MAMSNAKKRKASAGKKPTAQASKKNNASLKKNGASKQGPSNNKNKKNTTTNKKVIAKKKQEEKKEEEEEIDVEEEDVEFFESNAAANFLMKMDTKAFSKPVHLKSNRLKAMEEVEKRKKHLEEAEAKPRKAAWEKKTDLSTKLPVKYMDGTVRPNKLMAEDENKPKDQEQHQEEEEDEEEDDDEDGVEYGSDVSEMEFEEVVVADKEEEQEQGTKVQKTESEPILSPMDLKRIREHRIAQKKIEIAHLCEKILENPEEAMKKNKEHEENWSLLQQLHALCEDQDLVICQLSMVSELSVLLDILPDYRIRLEDKEVSQTSKQKQQQHKKKVQQLMEFEASLLHHYQNFLKFCNQLMSKATKFYFNQEQQQQEKEDDTKSQSQQQHQSNTSILLAETAIKCLCELFKMKFGFNFSLNLILSLIPWSANCVVDNIRLLVCESFQKVFQNDKSYQTSLLIIQQITIYLKKKNQKIKFSNLLDTFTSLNLDQTMEEGEKARKKFKADRKKRRQSKDSIASGLKEAEAIIDPNEKSKTQADILHEMVLIYFRFLKNQVQNQHMSNNHSVAMVVLPSVFKGLTKFGFLINLDIMIDLLQVLKVLLQQSTNLPLTCALQAVLTSLKTLQGPSAQELMIDEKEFVDILYTLLKRFTILQEPDRIQSFPIALECIEAVFLRRKEIVVDRVAAFIKRLLLISIHLPPNQILAIMAIVRSLMHRYAKLQQLLESDLDRVASGEYRAEVDDPDFANPYASACWEVALLNRHYHPFVASFSLGTASLGPSLPNEAPKRLLEVYNVEQKGEFIPKVSIPKPNQLHQKLIKQNMKNQKKKYLKPIFINPPTRPPSNFLTKCMALQQDQEKEDRQIDFATQRMNKKQRLE